MHRILPSALLFQCRLCVGHVLAILMVVAALSADARAPDTLEQLSQLQWRNRVILVRGSELDLQRLRQRESDIMERDIIWILWIGEAVHTNTHRPFSDSVVSWPEHQAPDSEVNTLLIGKDGGIKVRDSELKLDELFGLIDSMPMRIQETN